MKAQTEQGDGYAVPDIIVALNDLAHLSQQVALSAPGVHNPVPGALLKRLLRLFKGQRSALLLTLEKPTGTDITFAHKRSVRSLALQSIEEEEALALLSISTFDESSTQPQSTLPAPGWMVGRIPLVPLANALNPASLLPSVAIFVVGWVGKDKTALAEQGQALFSSVATIVGTVIANILLAERVQVLESSSNRKAIHEMELLKAELLATISHELRSPLASIKGYAATLLRHEQRISFEERHEFLLAINESSDRLAILIDRLLEMSQLETGTIVLKRAPVNLPHLVREAITALGQRLDGQRIIHFDGQVIENTRAYHASEMVTFTLQVEDQSGQPSKAEPVIHADRQRLREVVDNLLENAILYSPDGGTVEVVLRPTTIKDVVGKYPLIWNNEQSHSGSFSLYSVDTANQQMVELCISDHGIGIPYEHLERIFDHFHRVDTRLTREVNGLGLGLSICKRIIELHNGIIWAESEPGLGSSFHVLLPLGDNVI
jgi:signal transduction histidine kinase